MKQISLSGVIGWDCTAQDLRDGLKAANGEDVEIVISSPGGFVSTGLEMFNLLRNYAGHTTARLSGYAMSIASYIPLACKKIVAEDNAIYMIHNVRGGVFGDHNEILNYGKTTQGMSNLIARAYAKKTCIPLADVQAMMDKETYFFGQDMVDSAFVDEIIATETDKDPETARALAHMAYGECVNRMASDLTAVKQDLAACATILASAVQHTHKKTKSKETSTMTKEQLKAEFPELYQEILTEGQTAAAGSGGPMCGTCACAACTCADGECATCTTKPGEMALAEATAAGAAAENARIKDVRAQAIPGHEALIEALAFDGKSTGADAALAIVAAEKSLRNAAQNQLNSAGQAVPVTDGGDASATTMKRAEFDALDQNARRAFLAAGGKLN